MNSSGKVESEEASMERILQVLLGMNKEIKEWTAEMRDERQKSKFGICREMSEMEACVRVETSAVHGEVDVEDVCETKREVRLTDGSKDSRDEDVCEAKREVSLTDESEDPRDEDVCEVMRDVSVPEGRKNPGNEEMYWQCDGRQFGIASHWFPWDETGGRATAREPRALWGADCGNATSKKERVPRVGALWGAAGELELLRAPPWK